MRIFYLFLTLVVVMSCSISINGDHTIIEEDRLVKVDCVESVKINVPLYDCIDLICLESNLILRKHKSEKILSVVDLNEGVVLSDFASRGRGHNEFLSLSYSSVFEESDEEFINLIDRHSALYYTVNVTETIELNTISISKKIDFPKSLTVNGFSSLYEADNGDFVGIDDSCNSEPFLFNSKSGKISYGNHVFEAMPNQNNRSGVFQSNSTHNMKNHMLASAMFSIPVIEIWDYKHDKLNSLFYKSIVTPAEIDIENPKFYFVDIDSDDDYIYALLDDDIEMQSSKIIVAEWNGEYVATFDIPYATSMAINKITKDIYLLNSDASSEVISKFNITNVMNEIK